MHDLTRITLSVAAIVAAAACQSQPTPPPTAASASEAEGSDPQATILRTYEVPAGMERTIVQVLSHNRYRVRTTDENGAVQSRSLTLDPQVVGQGRIILAAPRGMHEGVDELIAAFREGGAQPAASHSISVTYWLVVASPSEARATGDGLAEVQEALEALTNLGTMHFELLEKQRLVGLDGERVRSEGRISTIRHDAVVNRDAIELNLGVSAGSLPNEARLDTSIGIRPEQFAVLGQAGFVPPEDVAEKLPSPGNTTLFYVARAQVLD